MTDALSKDGENVPMTTFYVFANDDSGRFSDGLRPATAEDITDEMVHAAATAIAMYDEGFEPNEDELIYARLALEAVFRGQ